MRVLVTGATGFVGAHLCAHLLDQGDDVLGVSRSARWRSAVEYYPSLKSIDVIRWDIRHPADDATSLAITSFQPDVIFHLAAISIPADCGKEEATPLARSTNVDGTRHVIDVARACASPPKFLLASSCHVYGRPGPESDSVSEDAPERPENGYGITKCEAESELRKSTRSGELLGIALRGFQQTGPLQSDRMLLPQWSRQFAESKEPVVVRSLDTTLDLMDIRDAVHFYRHIAALSTDSDLWHGNPINVASGSRHTGHEIIRILSDVSQHKPQIEQTDPRSHRNPIANVDRLRGNVAQWRIRPMTETVTATLEYWRRRIG